LCSVGRGVVDDYEFPGEVAVIPVRKRIRKRRGGALLLGEGALKEPGDYWEVLAFIVGRDDNGVFICCCGRH
jgi:hypothetical protein